MLPRQRWALGGSLLIHIGLVLLIGASLVTPQRIVNRVEIDLKGMTTAGQASGGQAPSPVQAPSRPTVASMPVPSQVPLHMRVPKVAVPPPPASYDPDASLVAPLIPALPGQPAVALQRSSGGVGGRGSGIGAGTGTGSGFGTGTGAGGGSGSGRGGGSVLDGYRHAVRMRIDRAKRYPQIAQQRRIEGTALVTFRLSSAGQLIAGPILVKSSGYGLIDKAALRAVRRGAPYPKYPGEADPAGHAFEVPVRFHLR